MANITETARKFFEAREAFAAQSEPLTDIRTLRAYTDWMKRLLTFMPDGHYAIQSFATNQAA